MSVPSKAEMEHYVTLLESVNAYEIGEKIADEMPLISRLTSLCEEALDLMSQRVDLLENNSVQIWLHSDHAHSLAAKRVNQRNESISRDEWISESVSYIAQHIERYRSEGILGQSLLRRILPNRFRPNRYIRWTAAVVKSLIEYHYTDNDSVIADYRRLLPGVIANAVKALQDLNLVIETHFAENSDILDLGVIKRSSDRTLAAIEKRAYEGFEESFPIKRKDKTTKERLFVYRMLHAHRAIFRRPKSEIIALLLQIEGIANPLDERGIQKLCAQYLATLSATGRKRAAALE